MPNFDLIENTGTKPTTPDPPTLRELEEFPGVVLDEKQAQLIQDAPDVSYAPGAPGMGGEPQDPRHMQGYATILQDYDTPADPDAAMISWFMKAKDLGLAPLLKLPPAAEGWSTVAHISKKKMSRIDEQDKVAHSNYLEAVDKRQQLVATYLEEHPPIAHAYMEAHTTGDSETGYEIEDAIIEELAKVYPDINQYDVTPEKKELWSDVELSPGKRPGMLIKGAQKYFPKEFEILSKASKTPVAKALGAPQIPDPKDWVKTTPAVTTQLGKSYEEKLYQGIINGEIGNLYAKPNDKKNYIPDDLVNFYAGMVKARSTDFTEHKHHRAIRHRLGEQIAHLGGSGGPLGGGIKTAQWTEAVASAIPFREQLEEAEITVSHEERLRREKLRTLMDLSDESVTSYQMVGVLTGAFLTYGGAYGALTKMGLTSFMGANARPVASLLATMPVELAVDTAYNPHGYSFLLGSLLEEDENRLVSGVESVILGTMFNLTASAVKTFKGVKRQKLVDAMIANEEVGHHQRRILEELKRKAKSRKGELPTAKQIARTPAVEEGFLKLSDADAPTQLRVGRMMEEAEAVRLTELDSMEQALENANTMLQRSFGHLPALEKGRWKLIQKQLQHRIAIAQNDRPRLPSETRNSAHATARQMMEGSMSKEARMRVDPLREEITLKEDPFAPPPTPSAITRSADDVMGMLDDTMPEGYWMDLEEAAKVTKSEEPFNVYGYTRKMVREGLRKNNLSHLGLSLLGGGLAMEQSDQDNWGAFFAGMLLPAAARNTGKWALKTYRGISEVAGYGFTPAQSTIKRLDEGVWWGVVVNDFRKQTQKFQRLEKIGAFFDHMDDLTNRNVISEKTKQAIYEEAALGGRRDWVHDEFKRIEQAMPEHQRGVIDPLFREFQKVFTDFGDEAIAINFEMGLVKEKEFYLPRYIKPENYDKFLELIGETKPQGGVIDRAWDKWAEKMGKATDALTDAEKAHIANTVINTRGWDIVERMVSHQNTRKFKEVPQKFRHLYEPLDKTSRRYVNIMTDAFEDHKFLGMGVTTKWLDEVVEVAPGAKDVSPYKTLKTGPKRVTESLHETLGGKITEMMNGRKLSDHKQNLLIKKMRQLYLKPVGKPMGPLSKFVRDLTYSATIGNFYSTVTQSTDVLLAASVNSRGMGGSVIAEAVQRVSGGKGRMAIGLEAMGFDSKGLKRMALEFEDESFMRKWLQRNLKATGFSWMDIVGKESLINGALREMRTMASGDVTTLGYKSLSDEFAVAMGGIKSSEFTAFVEALRMPMDIAKKDPNVLAAVFSRLTAQHPITKASMPLGYSLHPRGRLMYQLKTFMIKQIDLARLRIIDEIAKGSKQVAAGNTEEGARRVGRGLKDLVRYAGVFGLGQQGANVVKDWFLGREVSLSDRKMSWFAQNFGVHRMYFHMFKDIFDSDTFGKSIEAKVAVMGLKFFSPAPFSITLNAAAPDFAGWLSGDLKFSDPRGERLRVLGVPTGFKDKWLPYLKGRLWRYLPLLGKDVWWRIGAGFEQEAGRHISPGYRGGEEGHEPRYPEEKPERQPRFPER